MPTFAFASPHLVIAIAAATTSTYDAVARELNGSISSVHAVRAAALLQESLRHDPGWFPKSQCAAEMCEAPDALTPLSSRLVDPMPVWKLLDALDSTGDARMASKQAIYDEYVEIVRTVLKPHLLACKRPAAEWVAEKTASLLEAPKDVAAGAGGANADSGYSDGGVGAAVDALIEELVKISRFELGLNGVMRARAKKLETGACPNLNDV